MPSPGQLIVLEGPDGVGKSSLASALAAELRSRGRDCVPMSFPGRSDGSLGKLVYDLHHQSEDFGVASIDPTSLQVLHVAAHIDALNRTLLPALAVGQTVILDRYWWSTLVYGMVNDVSDQALGLMVELESVAWRGKTPDVLFLVHREVVGAPSNPSHSVLSDRYADLARKEGSRYRVVNLDNNGSFAACLRDALAALE